MARKFIKRFMPDPLWIKQQRSLKILGSWIHDPNMWHLTRHSVATAVFIGLFVAFIPLPTQMVIAGLLSIIFRANLPISVILVWISNPLTIAPIFYLAYKVGAVFIDPTGEEFHFDLSWQWLSEGLVHHWQPFLLGCVLCGLFAGLLGSTMARIAWRRHTLKRWHDRRLKRQNQPEQK